MRDPLTLLAMTGLLVTISYAGNSFAAPTDAGKKPLADITACIDSNLQTAGQAGIEACSAVIDSDTLAPLDRASALLHRARLHQAAGQREQALADYDALIASTPNNSEALSERAAIFRAKGDRRRALFDYTAALKADPTNSLAAAARKELVLELENIGARMGVK